MIIIDVREPQEYRAEHVDGALNLPLSDLENNTISVLEDISLDTELIVYCRSGGRAQVACRLLKQHGFENIRNGINKSEIEGQWCDA